MDHNDSNGVCPATTNCSPSGWLEETLQNPIDQALICLSIIAILANILVCFCACRLFFTRNRDTIHIYIASMTMGDLVVVSCQVFESLDSRRPLLGLVPCVLVYLLGLVGIAVSACSLVLLNGDKLLFFNFPLYYRAIKSVGRALKMCALVWLSSVGVTAYFWIADIVRIRDPTKCEMTVNFEFAPGRAHYYTLFMAFFCVCPIGSSLVVSCYLLRLMHIKRNIVNNPAGPKETTSQAPAFSNKVRSLAFIFTTTVWTALSLLPYRILMLYWMYVVDVPDICANHCRWLDWLYQAAWALVILLKLNPIVNPFITAIIYHPYRNEMAKRIPIVLHSHHSSSSTATTPRTRRTTFNTTDH